MSEQNLNHPYWDIYSRLTSLRTSGSSVEGRRCIAKLCEEAELGVKERFIIFALMMLPLPLSRSMIEERFFLVLRERFSYAALSPEILKMICSYSPLIDFGAGNGYNAWLLEQMGAEVLALDAYPVEEGRNWFFNTRFGLPTRSGRSWTQVKKGEARQVQDYPEHALLLCWPPKNSMALQALQEYAGRTVIFIGNKRCCANSSFYRKLKKEWRLETAVKTASWNLCHTEWLEIYSRNLAPGSDKRE